jgi:hypothetical protein
MSGRTQTTSRTTHHTIDIYKKNRKLIRLKSTHNDARTFIKLRVETSDAVAVVEVVELKFQ